MNQGMASDISLLEHHRLECDSLLFVDLVNQLLVLIILLLRFLEQVQVPRLIFGGG